MKKENFVSLDYPLFEKMKVRAPRAARLWLLGDRFFQVGLLLIMLFLPVTFFVYREWGVGTALALAVGGLVFSLFLAARGVYLKRESYKLAIAAGIDVTKV
ncbi:MAG TPA: hypothetical protein PK836_02300 [Syntrophales bacterium]|nr:hypothetical protein [Syntrophales bacterium]HOM06093.1 hypothetical protein [Syntrophales bacterium]HON99043.1 hypothetical protein [Syntrophales bacterium]HPC00493.1 hypothetical protein [Syntrophales bacterium]HPQ05576.1 hypothetical protein [Syntrophales bacterium]